MLNYQRVNIPYMEHLGIAILFLPPPGRVPFETPWVLRGHHEAHPGLQHLSLQKTHLDDMDATRLAEALAGLPKWGRCSKGEATPNC